MDSDEEPALGVIIIATFTENIKPKRSKKRERNGLNLDFKSDIPMDFILNYFLS